MTRRGSRVRTKSRVRAKKFRSTWDIALREGHKLALEHPSMSNATFRVTLRGIIDNIFELPPIAEEISDIVIAVVVDAVVWRIRASESKWVLVDRKWVKYAKECVAYAEKARNGK